MSPALQTLAQTYFRTQLGVELDALLAPLSPDQPCGDAGRLGATRNAIGEARREDDPSLPQGVWSHELKRADWDRVSRLCLTALAEACKDLQLTAWLLEAEINQRGLAGVAPALTLIQGLCQAWWPQLHPQPDPDGEEADAFEARANVFHWINQKLQPTLRRIPLTAAGREREYCLADWEQAHRLEQLRGLKENRREAEDELSQLDLNAALAATANRECAAFHAAAEAGAAAVRALEATLDAAFQDRRDSPSLAGLRGVLETQANLLAGELARRGHPERSAPAPAMPDDAPHSAHPAHPGGGAAVGADAPSLERALRDRNDAYAQLDAAADFLMRLEPHSPAPYLVRRAIEWGNLNTVALYQELFVRLGGQISIFELLGIEPEAKG